MKKMAWLYSRSDDKFRILHLKIDKKGGWRSYTCFPQYFVHDYEIPPQGSKGWATYQKLRTCGWELIATTAAEKDRQIEIVNLGDQQG